MKFLYLFQKEKKKAPHISGLQSREQQILQSFHSGLQLRYLITELTDF